MDEEVEDKNMESESSSSDDDGDKELELRTDELERQVAENHYQYDAHVELVGLYRKLGDLKSMRHAYERFHKYFPLTPQLWLSWIQDEIKLAHSSVDNEKILSLFDKAVDDYQSVKLWQEYAQFAMGSCSVVDTRAIFERGLNSVGLHAVQGSLLWDTLREFEMAHLSLAEPESEAFRTQLSRVVEVFRRQLSVPLIGMENTYKEWQEFQGQLPEDHGIDVQPIEWGYGKALKILDGYKPFEERLLSADEDADLYAVYKEYIRAIEDPSSVLCVYERAVVQLCLNPTFWADYCCYALKLGEPALKVSSRSLRNCPWIAQLWVARLRILEHLQKSDEQVLECFEEAVVSVPAPQMLDLWLSLIEYTKRTGSDADKLNKIFEQAHQQLGFESDPDSKVLRLQARIAARQNMQQARKIWSVILRNPQNKASGNLWLEYVALEKQFGEPKQVRNLFQKAITNCQDWQRYFTDEWLMYEREVGSLQEVLNCSEKCKDFVKETQDGQHHQRKPSDFASPNSKKRNFSENDDKRQWKKRKTHDSSETRTQRWRSDTKMEAYDVLDKSKNLQGPPADLDPAKSVFVSNLNSKVDEDKLRELFANCVKITIPKRRGLSRCFAYVQFSSDGEAQEALKSDRQPLDGRPVFVSECKPDRTQRQTVFKYSDRMEFNKLFVKGLPMYFTKENVEAIFKPYNATDVRLVKKFNGQFKGLAYVDFANDDDAGTALKNTNEMKVGEHTITVAISAPPSKKKEAGAPPPRQHTRNSKSKLEIPFVPRSVQVKKHSEEGHAVSKTNDDFRKLLLNK